MYCARCAARLRRAWEADSRSSPRRPRAASPMKGNPPRPQMAPPPGWGRAAWLVRGSAGRFQGEPRRSPFFDATECGAAEPSEAAAQSAAGWSPAHDGVRFRAAEAGLDNRNCPLAPREPTACSLRRKPVLGPGVRAERCQPSSDGGQARARAARQRRAARPREESRPQVAARCRSSCRENDSRVAVARSRRRFDSAKRSAYRSSRTRSPPGDFAFRSAGTASSRAL